MGFLTSGQIAEEFLNGRFLPGFQWAVGREYLPALKQCLFQEGDTLYSDRKAYGPWPGVGDAVPYMQVDNSAGAAPDSSFESNWDRSVMVRLHQQADGHEEFVVSTHGGIYRTLETGPVSWLFESGIRPIPDGAGMGLRRELRRVESDRAALLVPFDLVDLNSISKATRIARVIKTVAIVRSIGALGCRRDYRPTVRALEIDCKGMGQNDVHELVRQVVGTEGKKFSFGAHCVLKRPGSR